MCGSEGGGRVTGVDCQERQRDQVFDSCEWLVLKNDEAWPAGGDERIPAQAMGRYEYRYESRKSPRRYARASLG
jgi:hypothetical protein